MQAQQRKDFHRSRRARLQRPGSNPRRVASPEEEAAQAWLSVLERLAGDNLCITAEAVAAFEANLSLVR